MMIWVPTRRRVASAMLLAAMMASTVVLYLLAMALKVSPDLIVYRNGVGDGVKVGVGVEVLATGKGIISS